MQQNLLLTPIEYLKGVGPHRGELLRKELGIFKYGDLVNLFPNRYIDRTRYYKINELQNTVSEVQIIGKIIHIKTVEFGKNKKRLVATFVDDTGQMELVWFQGHKWIRESLKLNEVIVILENALHLMVHSIWHIPKWNCLASIKKACALPCKPFILLLKL